MAATVTVGCKLPHGFHLDIYEIIGDQPVIKERHTVEGANASQLIGGHGITPGVPEEFWNAWLALNKNTAMVRNGLIFASAKSADVVAKANDQEEVITGFEGIDPNRLPSGIEKAEAK